MGSTASDAVPEGGRTRRPRADAQRNLAAILDAAQECYVRDPRATIAEIAGAAGVGRVTLYGHFGTRAALVDAVLGRVLSEADVVLNSVDTSGEPVAALARLVGATWPVVEHFRAVLAVAEDELTPERIRDHHDRHLERMEAVIGRGQTSGAFRTDLPRQWLITLIYSTMHAAAAEVSAGRLEPVGAARVITVTLLAAMTPPGVNVPDLPL